MDLHHAIMRGQHEEESGALAEYAQDLAKADAKRANEVKMSPKSTREQDFQRRATMQVKVVPNVPEPVNQEAVELSRCASAESFCLFLLFSSAALCVCGAL